jgi:peptidoglycan/LPS O-acetylase OafA/YrhL
MIAVSRTSTGGRVVMERSDLRSYRPDVDGLRSLAIMAVVLYHAGVPFLSGGFSGVDIFFVISGYLIGGHIFSELRCGTFSYMRFYQRRAKRILPAYYLIISATILASMLLLSPFEAAEVGRNALAATLSASNILFARGFGYFNAHSELNPLLMTWSLGVEEQFYLFIPLLMVVLMRLRRKWVLPAILFCCAISFSFAVLQLHAHPSRVFYMLPTRAWELGIGVALAVAQLTMKGFAIPASLSLLVSTTGVVLLATPMFLLGPATPFPGAAALPSVLGTTMLLASPTSWINEKVLCFPMLVFIGRISYSFYLWHWPLLTFGRIIYGDKMPAALTACVIACAFGAAAFSYRFVEQPFRRSLEAPRPLLIRYGAVGFALLAVSGFVWLSQGVAWRYPKLAKMEVSGLSLTQDHLCLAGYGQDKPNISSACYQVIANRPTIAVWGDSHSASLAPGLRAEAKAEEYGFIQLGKSACLPLVGAVRYLPEHATDVEKCRSFNQSVLELLQADRSVRTVFLAGVWSAPFHGTYADGWLTSGLAPEGKIPTSEASRKLLRNSLAGVIGCLQAAGKRVVVFEDVPNFEVDPLWKVRTAAIPFRRKLALALGAKGTEDTGFALPRDRALTLETNLVLQETIADLPNVQLIDLSPALCRTPDACAYRDGESLLYSDFQHLSAEGSTYVLGKVPHSISKGAEHASRPIDERIGESE